MMFRKEYEPPAASPALPALFQSVQSPSSGKSHCVKSTVVQTVFNLLYYIYGFALVNCPNCDKFCCVFPIII
jgi:hypothetical protein